MIRRPALWLTFTMGLAVSLPFCVPQMHAAPILYNLTFTVDPPIFISTLTTPPTGSFDYDANAPLSTAFSNFIVNWDGLSLDLTSAANSPEFGYPATTEPTCNPSFDSAGFFFDLTHASACNPATGPDPTYSPSNRQWSASTGLFNPSIPTSVNFLFDFNRLTLSDYLTVDVDITPLVPVILGESKGGFLATEAAPEPTPQPMLVLGALAILGAKRWASRATQSTNSD